MSDPDAVGRSDGPTASGRHPCLEHGSWVRAETERLLIRAPTEQDLEAVFVIHSAPPTHVFNPSGPHQSRRQSRRTLDRWLAHWGANGLDTGPSPLWTSHSE